MVSFPSSVWTGPSLQMDSCKVCKKLMEEIGDKKVFSYLEFEGKSRQPISFQAFQPWTSNRPIFKYWEHCYNLVRSRWFLTLQKYHLTLKTDGLSTFALQFQVVEDLSITILVHQFFAYSARVYSERWSLLLAWWGTSNVP